MRNSLHSILFMSLLVMFIAGCKKDDPSSEPAVTTRVKAVYYDTVLYNMFNYDAQGRIILQTNRYPVGVGTFFFDSIFYSYDNNILIKEVHIYQGPVFVSRGTLDNGKLIRLDGPISGTGDSVHTTYQYDQNGQLTRDFSYDDEENVNDENIYHLTDGNITILEWKHFDNTKIDTLEYLSKSNTIGWPNTGLTFLGKPCKNLPKSRKMWGNTTFSYEYDQYGRVVTMIEQRGKNAGTVMRYTYY